MQYRDNAHLPINVEAVKAAGVTMAEMVEAARRIPEAVNRRAEEEAFCGTCLAGTESEEHLTSAWGELER